VILRIVKYPNPVLRKVGEHISEVTPAIRRLAESMIETMHASGGVGLAAHQVGEPLQLAVIDVSKARKPSDARIGERNLSLSKFMPLVMINPRWFPLGTHTTPMSEGCLSFPDSYAKVDRHIVIDVQCATLDNPAFEFSCSGFLAQAIQHECDHLAGKLFIDYLPEDVRKPIEQKFTV
jgi:peptide deformylase